MTYTTPIQQALFAPFVNEQASTEVQLEQHTIQQAQVVASEEIRTVEISFYDHEIYAGEKLIARITHDDDDFVMQRWVVMVNDLEIHRAESWAKCHSYIRWHYTQGTLPVQEQEVDAPATTGNEVMVQVAAACDEFGFEVTDDGIYHNDVKLGDALGQENESSPNYPTINHEASRSTQEGLTHFPSLSPGQVGCTDGQWWVIRASSQHQTQVPCDSAADAVWSLLMVETSCSGDYKLVACEELLNRPFDELTTKEWEQLLEYKPFPRSMVLVGIH